jgi:hypothetical protein
VPAENFDFPHLIIYLFSPIYCPNLKITFKIKEYKSFLGYCVKKGGYKQGRIAS